MSRREPLDGERHVRAVLVFDLDLERGECTEVERREALESALATGVPPTSIRFLRASEPAAVARLLPSNRPVPDGATTAADSGAPQPPYAPALLRAHRQDLAEALGAVGGAEWSELLDQVRELRRAEPHPVFAVDADLGFGPIRRRS